MPKRDPKSEILCVNIHPASIVRAVQILLQHVLLVDSTVSVHPSIESGSSVLLCCPLGAGVDPHNAKIRIWRLPKISEGQITEQQTIHVKYS